MLRLSAERLVVWCEVGKSAHATLRVRSSGSAAVRFHWTASTCPPLRDGAAATPPLGVGDAGSSAGEGGGVRGSPLLMCRRQGAILPGQDIEFEFLFRPQRTGVACFLLNAAQMPWMPACTCRDTAVLWPRGADQRALMHTHTKRRFMFCRERRCQPKAVAAS